MSSILLALETRLNSELEYILVSVLSKQRIWNFSTENQHCDANAKEDFFSLFPNKLKLAYTHGNKFSSDNMKHENGIYFYTVGCGAAWGKSNSEYPANEIHTQKYPGQSEIQEFETCQNKIYGPYFYLITSIMLGY